MTEWMYFPRSSRCPDELKVVVTSFEKHKEELDSEVRDGMHSNEVLEVVRPALEGHGFLVETGKKRSEKINVPVLFGPGGVVEKAFEADAFKPSAGIVVEVEAGRAVVNNQFLKDLFQACMMQDVKYLAIAVRKVYRSGSMISRDFERVATFFETLYVSGRLRLPLDGVLIVGY